MNADAPKASTRSKISQISADAPKERTRSQTSQISAITPKPRTRSQTSQLSASTPILETVIPTPAERKPKKIRQKAFPTTHIEKLILPVCDQPLILNCSFFETHDCSFEGFETQHPKSEWENSDSEEDKHEISFKNIVNQNWKVDSRNTDIDSQEEGTGKLELTAQTEEEFFKDTKKLLKTYKMVKQGGAEGGRDEDTTHPYMVGTPTIEGMRVMRDFTKGLIEVPIFSGDATLTTGQPAITSISFCEKIELAFPDGNDADKIFQARGKLSGSALRFAQRKEIESIRVWEEFKTKLGDEFPINKNILRTQFELYSPRRKSRESVVEFGKRVSAELNQYSSTGILHEDVKIPKMHNILKEIVPWDLRFIFEDYDTPWLEALRELEKRIEYQPSSNLTRQAIQAETGIFAPVSVFTEEGNNLDKQKAEGQNTTNIQDQTSLMEGISNAIIKGMETIQYGQAQNQSAGVPSYGNNFEFQPGFNAFGMDDSQRPPSLFCRYCKRTGHIEANCFAKQRALNQQGPSSNAQAQRTFQQRPPITCWSCGRLGHRKVDCRQPNNNYRQPQFNNNNRGQFNNRQTNFTNRPNRQNQYNQQSNYRQPQAQPNRQQGFNNRSNDTQNNYQQPGRHIRQENQNRQTYNSASAQQADNSSINQNFQVGGSQNIWGPL